VTSLVHRRRRIVLTSVSSDSHTWNLVFLELLLKEHGSEVINLGACVPDAAVIEAVREHRPDAVVISSVNGHGHIDGARLITEVRTHRDPLVATVPVMIGGKLGIQGAQNTRLADELVTAGFDAVFTEGTDPAELARALDRVATGVLAQDAEVAA
jgi:methylaspartate mutase sigma subunit